jgi:hypothetical protein
MCLRRRRQADPTVLTTPKSKPNTGKADKPVFEDGGSTEPVISTSSTRKPVIDRDEKSLQKQLIMMET